MDVNKGYFTKLNSIVLNTLENLMPSYVMSNKVDFVDGKLLIEGIKKKYEVNLTEYKKIRLLGTGKCAVQMADGLPEEFQNLIDGGMLLTNDLTTSKLKNVTQLTCSHPYPSLPNFENTIKFLNYCKTIEEDDLVIFLLSGGSSSMLVYPREPVTIVEKINLNKLLVQSGLKISEINEIRKVVSSVKAGGLLNFIRCKKIVQLIVSDVPGNMIKTIGSGPLIKSKINKKRVLELIEKKFGDQKTIKSLIEKLHDIPEITPQNYTKVASIIMHDNYYSQLLMRNAFLKNGFDTYFSGEILNCTVEEGVNFFQSYINKKKLDFSLNPIAYIGGGEITTKVTGAGKGGRNLEFSMRMAKEINGLNGYYFIAVATDGLDGNSGVAGAIVDSNSYKRAEDAGFDYNDYLKEGNSLEYLKVAGKIIKNVKKGGNQNDLYILIKTG